jgi:hypothetical protein
MASVHNKTISAMAFFKTSSRSWISCRRGPLTGNWEVEDNFEDVCEYSTEVLEYFPLWSSLPMLFCEEDVTQRLVRAFPND